MELWAQAADRLANSGVEDARLEAEVMIRHSLGMRRAEFFAALEDRSDEEMPSGLDALLERRAAGEPLAYILGAREFYGLEFHVTPAVLIPRQETELLVDGVLTWCNENGKDRPHIADVGTGSGAIAVAAAIHLPESTVYATDSSAEALDVAGVNLRRHGVSDRVRLLRGDLLSPVQEPVDVVASNPPYLTTSELAGAQREVRREPETALDGGPDGLRTIERLLRQAPGKVRPGGLVLIEISPPLLAGTMEMAKEAFPQGSISFRRDLSGLARAVSVHVASDSAILAGAADEGEPQRIG